MLERVLKRYILNKQVRLKHDEASDKFYAFCIETGDYFVLNKSGYTILNSLDAGKNINEIVTLLAKELTVDNKNFLIDTIQFLELSEKNGIIASM